MRSGGRVELPRLAALLVWVGLLLGYQWYAWWQDLSMLEAVRRLIDFMSSGLAGPLIYVVFYALRPLVLFPASLLTWAAGFVFGPVLGLLFTVLGSNISASVAYLAGRYFGGSFQNTGYTLQGYAERLHGNSFESVLIMRLIFVPFDAVNYAAGSCTFVTSLSSWRRFSALCRASYLSCCSEPPSKVISPTGPRASTSGPSSPRCWSSPEVSSSRVTSRGLTKPFPTRHSAGLRPLKPPVSFSPRRGLRWQNTQPSTRLQRGKSIKRKEVIRLPG